VAALLGSVAVTAIGSCSHRAASSTLKASNAAEEALVPVELDVLAPPQQGCGACHTLERGP
jgi:hypothetical protein